MPQKVSLFASESTPHSSKLIQRAYRQPPGLPAGTSARHPGGAASYSRSPAPRASARGQLEARGRVARSASPSHATQQLVITPADVSYRATSRRSTDDPDERFAHTTDARLTIAMATKDSLEVAGRSRVPPRTNAFVAPNSAAFTKVEPCRWPRTPLSNFCFDLPRALSSCRVIALRSATIRKSRSDSAPTQRRGPNSHSRRCSSRPMPSARSHILAALCVRGAEDDHHPRRGDESCVRRGGLMRSSGRVRAAAATVRRQAAEVCTPAALFSAADSSSSISGRVPGLSGPTTVPHRAARSTRRRCLGNQGLPVPADRRVLS